MMRRDLGLLLLRGAVGTILLVHGVPKLFGGGRPPAWSETALGPVFVDEFEQGGVPALIEELRDMPFPAPEASAWLCVLAEFGGGLALIVGAATPLAGVGGAITMAIISRQSHGQQGAYGPGGYEFTALLAIASLALAFTGPGRWSLDHALRLTAFAPEDRPALG